MSSSGASPGDLSTLGRVASVQHASVIVKAALDGDAKLGSSLLNDALRNDSFGALSALVLLAARAIRTAANGQSVEPQTMRETLTNEMLRSVVGKAADE